MSIHENIFDEQYYLDHPIPATYQRGNRKIDHILCTPHMMDCVTNAAILGEHIGSFSNHRYLVVDFAQRNLGMTDRPMRHPRYDLKRT